jgi:hypothetical protein
MGTIGHVPWQMWWFNNAVSEGILQRIAPPQTQAFPKFVKWLETRLEEHMKTGPGR